MDLSLTQKYECLKETLAAMGKVAVGFSAGVDSTLLLAVAHEVLGENAVAFTATSPAFPASEADCGKTFCQERGIKQVFFAPDELSLEEFDHNPPDRCYRCKSHLFQTMKALAAKRGIIHVLEGSNLDDLADHRPGRLAIEEQGVECPLLDCGFTKQDIRELSRALGLPTWDKPAMACLYTRFAFGDVLTEARLSMVEQAEAFLQNLGFAVVRVRVEGEGARIELAPECIPLATESLKREIIDPKLRALGFKTVVIDPHGYKMGSMNKQSQDTFQ